MRTLIEQVEIIVDEWPGLYKEAWSGVITPDAFKHPAKFSRALIRKIYEHAIDEGWVRAGDRIVDPFGGVALGSFDAMQHGLHWTGCELEEKFVTLGSQNIALWDERFERMPNWGSARLVQGDSRKLAEVLTAVECCVSSPPYGQRTVHGQAGIDASKYAERNRTGHSSQATTMEKYGEAKGQLANLPATEAGHSLAVSSPPYNLPMSQDHNGTRGGKRGTDPSEKGAFVKYGNSEGQLEGMSAEGFDAAITSPPYESVEGAQSARKHKDPEAVAEKRAADYANGTLKGNGASKEAILAQLQRENEYNYGVSPGQLGNQKGETFWSASRLILEQLYSVLVPGAHAIFVVKAFVRNKQIVDFPGQWAQLCEAVGFKLLHDHHALLVENSGTQGGFHQDKQIRVERKSFFRRLAEAKGSPRIDHENVLCFVKPEVPA